MRVWNDHTITDDDLGHIVLIHLRALGIGDEFMERCVPWADISEIDDAAARIKLTSANTGEVIGHAIGLTYEQREAHKAWSFRPYDKTWDEVQKLNGEKRNEKKRAKRVKRVAQIRAVARPLEQVEVYASVDRLAQRPGYCVISVTDIMEDIARTYPRCALHGQPTPAMRSKVHRILDILEHDGLLRPLSNGRGGRKTLLADRDTVPVVTLSLNASKPWEAGNISRRTWFRRLRKARDTGHTHIRATVSPVLMPQTVDEAGFSALKSPKNPMAHLYSERATERDDSRGGETDKCVDDGVTAISSASTVDDRCPGNAGLGDVDTSTDSAANTDQHRGGGEAVVDEVTLSTTSQSRPAVSLPREDGHRFNPGTSTALMPGEATGISLEMIEFQRVVLASSPTWRVPMASPVRLDAMAELVRIGQRIEGLLAWLAAHRARFERRDTIR
jgi:hypothetical protein